MRKTKDIYDDFCKLTECRKNELFGKIENLDKTKVYLLEQIEANIDYLTTKGFVYDDFINNNFGLYRIKKLNVESKYKAIINNYYRVIADIKKLSEEYSNLSLLELPYEAFSDILMEMNREIMKYVLNGYIHTFGNKVGRLFINEIERVPDETTGEFRPKVDWGSSWKYHDQLVDEGKTPYNAKTAPDGIKWFVYFVDEFVYWFTWRGCTIKGRSHYYFVPTNYCHTHKQSQLLYVKNVKTKDEILNTKALGNRDKLHALLRFDPQQFLKYRRIELKLN